MASAEAIQHRKRCRRRNYLKNIRNSIWWVVGQSCSVCDKASVISQGVSAGFCRWIYPRSQAKWKAGIQANHHVRLLQNFSKSLPFFLFMLFCDSFLCNLPFLSIGHCCLSWLTANTMLFLLWLLQSLEEEITSLLFSEKGFSDSMRATFTSATTWTAEGAVVNCNAPSEKLASSPFSQLPEVHFTLFPLF